MMELRAYEIAIAIGVAIIVFVIAKYIGKG